MRQAGSVAVHLVVDSTGLKIFGEGEWLAQGNMPPLAQTHLGLDLASGAIVCADLTHDEVGDSTALPGLLDQLDAPVAAFWLTAPMMERLYGICWGSGMGRLWMWLIPPPKNAVIRPQSARDPTVRDPRSAATAAWPGKWPQGTTNAAG